MPSVRDFLERLRPSGTPGAAAISAVPADRTAERSAELDPVLARLDAVQAEALLIRQQAEVEAQRRRASAAERARALVAAAHRAAEADRRDVVAEARSLAETESRDLLSKAAAEASAVAAAARDAQSRLVAQVLGQARSQVTEIIGGAR